MNVQQAPTAVTESSDALRDGTNTIESLGLVQGGTLWLNGHGYCT
jgi:hypothetical protein